MYIAHAILSCMMCVFTQQIVLKKEHQGITNISLYPIQGNSSITQVLFGYNSLSHIPYNYFMNLPNLYYINLRVNIITTIDPYAYAGIPNVTHIHLRKNRISEAHQFMFAGLFNLRWLSLKYNRVQVIQVSVFEVNTGK